MAEKIKIENTEFYIQDNRTNKKGWVSFNEILEVIWNETKRKIKEN